MKNKNFNNLTFNFKDSAIYFLHKHYSEFIFIIYWLFILSISGFFLYISLKSRTYPNFYSYLIFSLMVFILGLIGHRYFYNYIKEYNPLINLMITFMLIIATLSGLIAYLILLIFSDLLERLPYFRFFGQEGDWINFTGIIIAGLITMLGITITINNQQKIREDDNKRKDFELAILATPVLSFELFDTHNNKKRRYRMKKDKNQKIEFSLMSDFYIKNISNNFAIIDSFKNTSIDKINLSSDLYENIESDKVIKHSIESGDIIPPNTSVTVEYNLFNIIDSFETISLNFQLEYFDFTKTNKYSINTALKLFIRIIDEEELEEYVTDGEKIIIPEDEYYIEVIYSNFVNKFKKIHEKTGEKLK